MKYIILYNGDTPIGATTFDPDTQEIWTKWRMVEYDDPVDFVNVYLTTDLEPHANTAYERVRLIIELYDLPIDHDENTENS